MPELEVPGATLHYQVVGQGPLLLTISGANGSYEVWQPLSHHLKDHFTVISYDRRGFSRSTLQGAQDYEHRLDRDADDAAALIKHLSPNTPATVLGTSSGAIVSFNLLLRHPDLIETLIPHEPPAVTLNPDFAELKPKFQDIYNTYRRWGIPPAMQAFADFAMLSEGEKAEFAKSRAGLHVFSDMMYWFEREFLYPFTEFKPADFEPYITELVPVNSEVTNKEAFYFRANESLTRALGLELLIFPGGHIGYATHAEAFAKELLDMLKERKATEGGGCIEKHETGQDKGLQQSRGEEIHK
ncbi:hypothetical protein M409DRAFT_30345 [Zasmidium cellare ATCC 36951]|uniref:AB hydrolase-1 domain-containing protein n=1 Tax=Zasmidium cellare ATCC 36951 TaxID=1080233 RepID=A0A6A6C0H7_ZASCE|nr:uncharacterized protein M409DRAFT_30345 [Zasmidium cellare ATCC 36951]KAF2159206.1 hypothetical protein M409DRAFT_30345 [Zasmidium cellare ATCC 36951]